MTTTQQGLRGDIGVTMFTVSDVDAAIEHYTGTLGFELRADMRFGEEGTNRWVEVAPIGSASRLSLNPSMGPNQPGGGTIGIQVADVRGTHEELAARGVDLDPSWRRRAPRRSSCSVTRTATTSR